MKPHTTFHDAIAKGMVIDPMVTASETITDMTSIIRLDGTLDRPAKITSFVHARFSIYTEHAKAFMDLFGSSSTMNLINITASDDDGTSYTVKAHFGGIIAAIDRFVAQPIDWKSAIRGAIERWNSDNPVLSVTSNVEDEDKEFDIDTTAVFVLRDMPVYVHDEIDKILTKMSFDIEIAVVNAIVAEYIRASGKVGNVKGLEAMSWNEKIHSFTAVILKFIEYVANKAIDDARGSGNTGDTITIRSKWLKEMQIPTIGELFS